MSKFAKGAGALAVLLCAASPVLAAPHHHHGKHHASADKMGNAKEKRGGNGETTDDLNAKSLNDARGSMAPAGTAPVSAPMAAPTMPNQSGAMSNPAGNTMPSNAPSTMPPATGGGQ